MSAKDSPYAKPGVEVSAYVCGFTDDEGSVCGASAIYEIRFADWDAAELAGTCEAHAGVAREMGNLERIWSA